MSEAQVFFVLAVPAVLSVISLALGLYCTPTLFYF